MQEHPPPLSRRVRRTVVRGAAVAGVPSREVVEELGLAGGDVVRVEEELAAYCVSCNRVSPAAAVCCVCGGGMCGNDGCLVFCSEESCGKAVCARDRQRINGGEEPPKYLCTPHGNERTVEILLAFGLVVATAAAFLHFAHW